MRLRHAFGGGGVARQQGRRPGRTQDEIAAAIRAGAAEPPFDAIGAKRAFERANPRARIAIGQVAVATFAIRAQRKRHGSNSFAIFVRSRARRAKS
jgi:hypothetical protein